MNLRSLPLLALVTLAPLGGASDPLDPVYRACAATVGDGPAHAACVGQVDGGRPGDASDSCADPSPEVFPGTAFEGWLVGALDPADNYALQVPSAGMALTVSVQTAPTSLTVDPAARHRVTVSTPSGATLCAQAEGTATPGDPFSFTTTTAGVHTLTVVEDLEAVEGEPILVQPPLRACHMMCLVMNKTGYVVTVALG